MGKIQIAGKNGKVFYKVTGDNTEFYDLDNLLLNHPELTSEVIKNRIELERVLMQQRELRDAFDMV